MITHSCLKAKAGFLKLQIRGREDWDEEMFRSISTKQ